MVEYTPCDEQSYGIMRKTILVSSQGEHWNPLCENHNQFVLLNVIEMFGLNPRMPSEDMEETMKQLAKDLTPTEADKHSKPFGLLGEVLCVKQRFDTINETLRNNVIIDPANISIEHPKIKSCAGFLNMKHAIRVLSLHHLCIDAHSRDGDRISGQQTTGIDVFVWTKDEWILTPQVKRWFMFVVPAECQERCTHRTDVELDFVGVIDTLDFAIQPLHPKPEERKRVKLFIRKAAKMEEDEKRREFERVHRERDEESGTLFNDEERTHLDDEEESSKQDEELDMLVDEAGTTQSGQEPASHGISEERDHFAQPQTKLAHTFSHNTQNVALLSQFVVEGSDSCVLFRRRCVEIRWDG
ncbi:hypothetical protein BLNAU_23743 [Blattamonas nauphoetae]|uniref:Uncharacterized protein n=1 Tax=Blattamonas nauphoetae TaxID=2049346 RepID=A0ABQ9WRF3_9EUKA|nr:hypothetical protein BLNAU_23743 [Blattamonas nauphoetae]